jgi:hypothetical protein
MSSHRALVSSERSFRVSWWFTQKVPDVSGAETRANAHSGRRFGQLRRRVNVFDVGRRVDELIHEGLVSIVPAVDRVCSRIDAWNVSPLRITGGCSGEEEIVFPMRRLDIYLNDHFAGATFGMELSRRAATENRGTELGDFLHVLHEEIVEDRQTLRAVMNALGIEASPVKPAGAWLLEKAGRLKLNGQLRGHSPLSPLVELEGLEAGVSGKRCLWQVLERAFPGDPRLRRFQLAALVARAEEQLQGLQEHRLLLGPDALREERNFSADRGLPTYPC